MPGSQRRHSFISSKLILILILLSLFLGFVIFQTIRQNRIIEKKENDISKYNEPENEYIDDGTDECTEYVKNVWICDVKNNTVTYLYDNELHTLPMNLAESTLQEGVADITITDGKISEIIRKEKIANVTALRITDEYLEAEGIGTLRFEESFQAYLCTEPDIPVSITVGELPIGYGELELYADGLGKDESEKDGSEKIGQSKKSDICAVVQRKTAHPKDLRVLLRNSDFSGIYHDELNITATSGLKIYYKTQTDTGDEEINEKVKVFAIDKSSDLLNKGRIYIEPVEADGKLTITTLERAQGSPSYSGRLELCGDENGIIVINVVSPEEYLLSVVPSEMPSSYPMEALKAQAICARSYAYKHMFNAGLAFAGAHVDDSTAYQVYNNISLQDRTTEAVRQTAGEVLVWEKQPADIFYYSTSCGVGSDPLVWKRGEEIGTDYLKPGRISKTISEKKTYLAAELEQEDRFAEFIRNKDTDDFEADDGFYRWNYHVEKVNPNVLYSRILTRYEADNELVLTKDDGEFYSTEPVPFEIVYSITVTKRGGGGIAEEVVIDTDSGTYKIIKEYNIRYVLNDGETPIIKNDGKAVTMNVLLPSAFFIVESRNDEQGMVEYTLYGGGYGHGVGMSQNAARHMAENDYSAERILSYFFEGCTLERYDI